MSRYSHTKNRYFHLKSGCAKWLCTGCQDHCTSVNKCKYDVQLKAYKEGYLAAEKEYAFTEEEHAWFNTLIDFYRSFFENEKNIDILISIKKKVLGE